MRMLLSDAIMTGSVFIKKWNAASWCGCAIGMASASLKGEQVTKPKEAYDSAVLEWPFLEFVIDTPSCMSKMTLSKRLPIEWIISHLFCEVTDRRMSLESLVDVVQEIESQFPTPVEQLTPTSTPELEPVAVH